jgi:hypothetical protein
LPEGYVKYKEKGSVLSFDIPVSSALYIGEANYIAYEFMDALVNKLFGFHVLESKVEFKEQVKAKSLFQK